MKKRIAFAVAVLCLMSLSAFARPTHDVEQWHYDENGDLVGYWHQSCAGGFPYQEGVLTDTYSEFVTACPWTFETFGCGDVGLESTSCSDYCVTSSYAFSVGMGTIEDPFGCIN